MYFFNIYFVYPVWYLTAASDAGQVTYQRLTWTHLCQVSYWTLMCLLSAGLTAATMAEALKLQKMRMMMGFHGNSDQQRHHNGAESENDDTGTSWHHHQSLNLKDVKDPIAVSSLLVPHVGGSEGSWEKEQRLLSPPPSSAVAPPPGSASLHLNTLQHHSTLLANRESRLSSDWMTQWLCLYC